MYFYEYCKEINYIKSKDLNSIDMKKIVFLLISFLGITCLTQAQIKDVQTETSLDSSFQKGILKVKVQLTESKYKGMMLQYTLTDHKKKVITQTSISVPQKQNHIEFIPQTVNKPHLWNSEYPNLYTLSVTLMKKNKTPIDSLKKTILFRHTRFTEKEMLVNGKSIRIKGIHVRSLDNLTTPKQQKKAIKEWKKHHINAVRIAENPQNEDFFTLCNQYGIYVLNEAAGADPTHPALREGCLWEWPNKDLPVKMEEMKKIYQDIHFFNFNPQTGSISIKNLYNFTNLNQFEFYYIIRDHGKEIYRNTLEKVTAAPGETFVYKGLKGFDLERKTTGDVRIEFYAQNRKHRPFLPKGSIIAREQTYIHTFFRPDRPATPSRILLDKMITSNDQVIFQGKDLQLVFDKNSGMLVSYLYQGEEYLHQAQGMHPFFWRAPTQTDRIARLPEILKPWKDASYQPTIATSFQCLKGKDTELATILVTYHFPQTSSQWDINYKVYTDGTLKVNNRFLAENTQTAMIPRVGLRMQLTPALNTCCYFGRGPRTNYRDCRTAQFLGEYTSSIHQTHENCQPTQENSHRTDIYWCALTGTLKGGLLFVADRTFETNITDQLLENLEKGSNQPAPLVDCFIDFRMMGIGADNRPGTPVQEPYLIRPGKDHMIEYGFTILPFQKGEEYKKYILKY